MLWIIREVLLYSYIEKIYGVFCFRTSYINLVCYWLHQQLPTLKRVSLYKKDTLWEPYQETYIDTYIIQIDTIRKD